MTIDGIRYAIGIMKGYVSSLIRENGIRGLADKIGMNKDKVQRIANDISNAELSELYQIMIQYQAYLLKK
jgi:hypothetical protein